MISPAICDECRTEHRHRGRCGEPAEIVIPTSGGGIAKSAPCSCEAPETVGVKDPDTQTEVALR